MATQMRKPLSRPQVSEYIRLEGLQKLTGVTAHEWDMYLFKELVDNALDADEAAGIAPSVTVEMRYDGVGLTITVQNQCGFPLEAIDEIFDFTKRTSVKDVYNLPTRGAQGNALKTLLGIPYALQYRFFSDFRPELAPLTIASGQESIELWLDVDEFSQSVALRSVREPLGHPVQGTRLTVNIFQFTQERPRIAHDLLRMARAFALWNPHATFACEFVVGKQPHPFRQDGDPRWQGKYDLRQPAPIRWYTFSAFKELLFAFVLHARVYHEDEPTLGDVAALFGLPGFPSSAHANSELSLLRFLEAGKNHEKRIRWIYDLLVKLAAKFPTPSLGTIGQPAFTRLQAPSAEGGQPLFYRSYEASEDQQRPFVLEVALSLGGEASRTILTGINHTPTYRNLFLTTPLPSSDLDEPQRGLDRLLDMYGITDQAPVTLAVHLISPTITYENYGKSAISDEPYRAPLAALIAEIAREYLAAIETPAAPDFLSEPARKYLPTVIQALSGTFYSESQLVAALKRRLRQLGEPRITADLAQPDCDERLLAAIDERRQHQPIRGLIVKRSGRLAVPNHPHDAVHVALGEQPLQDLLRHFQARAIVITGRDDLDELLLALRFPVRYDVAVLRIDGNLPEALALLVKNLVLAAPPAARRDPRFLVPLWVVRDATIEGALLASTVRGLLRKYGLAEQCVSDLGLHTTDPALDEAWVGTRTEGEVERRAEDALRAAGATEDEVRFYVGQRQFARLDTLAPTSLIAWFERRLREADVSLKFVPDITAFAEMAATRLSERFRQIIARAAYESYTLDDVLSGFIGSWRELVPDWQARLREELIQRLEQAPFESWERVLERAEDQLLKRYVTEQRLKALRDQIRSLR